MSVELPTQFTPYETSNNFDFYTSSGEFNLALFNKTFREEQLKRIAFFRNEERKRLEELNNLNPPEPKLHELTIGQHIINAKNTVFDIIEDLLTKPLTTDILTKNNRLFYIGIILMIVYVVYLIIDDINKPQMPC